MPKSQSKSSRMTKSPFNSNFQIKSFSSRRQAKVTQNQCLCPWNSPSQKAFPEELEIKQNELRCGQPPEQVTQRWNVRFQMLCSISLGGTCLSISFQKPLAVTFCTLRVPPLRSKDKNWGLSWRTQETFYLSFLSLHAPLLSVNKNEAVEQQCS